MRYSYNSKNINPGDTFICLPGGSTYIEEALRKGAVEVLKMNRIQMAELANKFFHYPSKSLKVIGVTGTNGKTTTTNLIARGLQEAGYKPYVSGTLNSELTTPESLDIQELMAEHLKNGGTHFIMEVSSHGIDQGRIAGIDFDIKILTNITQDHLDYHKTFENYKKTKLSFMQENDKSIKIYPEQYKKINIFFESPLIGRFNYENMQAAVLALQSCGISDDLIKTALQKARPPAGRFENINTGQSFMVIIDYAHTPDGLKNILMESKHLADNRKGRLLTVFGCGGDRDRGKRPKMGKIASEYSAYFIITQDNPRTEDPEQINNDIIQGIDLETCNYEIILDRREAIKSAIAKAEAKDVVVIAGKGHEQYQILASRKIHFDDKEEAVKAIEIKESLNNNKVK
ncbi:MAG: UDP-N-acetylmuramoyl-L-alanyl-D-glutamate--2,6-diaminopimelate ligase [bacterium]|nr:UDP-N-acetylmuramoyl-L-alanyl-D-glutamate--2,6-diaminopimelate ligase [bacterium]